MKRKTYEAKRGAGGWVTVSTPSVDRDGDIVEMGGLDLSQWKRAGSPLFWGHTYDDPHSILGRARDSRITASAFELIPEWRKPVSDTDPQNVILSLWEKRLANSFSIGFIPVEWEPLNGNSRRITRSELLEVSLVAIGSQRDAVRGLSLKGMRYKLARTKRKNQWIEILNGLLDVCDRLEMEEYLR